MATARANGKPRTFANKKWERKPNSNPTTPGDLNAIVQKSQEQLQKIKKALAATRKHELNAVDDVDHSDQQPSEHDPMDEDLMDQVDTLIDDLTKAQVASEQITTPGGRYSETN